MPEFHSYGSYSAELAADFIAEFEGLRLTAYHCPAGRLTIGYGHTGADVHEGMTITKEEARALLIRDIEKHRDAFARYVNVNVTAGQFIALTSLVFNVGVGYVTHKCPKLMRALNSKRWEACADEFLDIVKSNGKVLPGLVRRREAESDLFLGE